MSKVILYIAASLDGYIARPDGNLDWLVNLPNPGNTDHGYADFLSSIGTTIMGRKTYEVVLGFDMEWPYQGIQSYVVTSDKNLDIPTPDTEVLSGDLIAGVQSMKMESGKDIWLIGGGKLITFFLNHSLIDRMIISVIPVILGEGIPLFPDNPKGSIWKLEEAVTYSTGVVSLIYERNPEPHS